MKPPGTPLDAFRIRRARSGETEALTHLALRSKASNGYDDTFMAACEGELTVRLEQILLGEIWLAEREDCIAGFFDLRIEAARGEVYAMFVDPAFKGQGVGRLLWEKLEERSVKLGATSILVDSDPHATHFYIRMGCTIVGEVPSGSIANRMLPQLSKTLPGN